MNEEEAMEIEVNEYVRTRAGHFYKITRIDENGLIYWNKIQCGWNIEQLKDIMVKHSKQLIDLIEAGDIVKDKDNKYEVDFVKDDKIYCNDYNLDDSLITLREQDIKAILTREQFKANCYKVGGEDEKI